jgi:hypothetical protein
MVLVAKKLVSTENSSSLVGDEDMAYRLTFYCVFGRFKAVGRGGRYAC